MGWLADVLEVQAGVATFRCDGHTEADALTLAVFRRECALLLDDAELLPPLSPDVLRHVLAACSLEALLSLEVTNRAALTLVRDFLRPAHWRLAALDAGTSVRMRDVVCLAAHGGLVACGLGDVHNPNSHVGGVRLLRDGVGVLDARTESGVTTVAVGDDGLVAYATAGFVRRTATGLQRHPAAVRLLAEGAPHTDAHADAHTDVNALCFWGGGLPVGHSYQSTFTEP